MALKRYRVAVTIAVIGAMSCVGTVLFSLAMARDRPRSTTATGCNSTPCQESRPETRGRRRMDDTACRSFYDFVCSRHHHARPLSHQQAMLTLATRLNASLSGFPVLSETLLRGSCPGHYALLGLDLHRACMGPTAAADWQQVERLLRWLGLSGWPLVRVRPLDRSPWDLAGLLDLRLGVFPIVRLSLRHHYGRVTMQLDRTPLPLRLHQLSVPPRDMGSYVRTVDRALSLLQGAAPNDAGTTGYWGAASAAIVELEQALERAEPRDAFVYGARLIPLKELPRSLHWNWAEYLSIVRDDSTLLAQANLTLLVREPEHLALATQTLGNSSAPVIFNYLGYRALVHLAPLLPAEAHFLLPLAPWADAAPPRLAGCLRLLAHLHPFVVRFFAGLQPGQTQYEPPKPGDSADALFTSAQRATATVVETLPWLEKGVGMRRARALLQARLVRGSAPSSEHCPQGPSLHPAKGGFLEALLQVQSAKPNAYWLLDSPDDGLDSRHQDEPFSMTADYLAGPNVVYASLALLTALKQRPLGDVQAAAPIVEALLRAALPGEPNELIRTPLSKLRCLARRMGTTQYDSHMPDQLRELLHPSALLQMTKRGNASPLPTVLVEGKQQLSQNQVFFVHWAMSLCDSPHLQKRLRRYKLMPTKHRVDVTLANHVAFQAAFRCPSGTAMHSSKACPPLTP
ncbi:hypothetical protein HPB49_009267 [Dermacentor silvarum]|uniref:Uncharacterized protein n=1 Tax=Dermacentor silvarum TaxID=543639 RepID=A0ACB8C8K9_DERSI|nr:hypothetical protein HPB49_009267 [Dermacentor silvarum]